MRATCAFIMVLGRCLCMGTPLKPAVAVNTECGRRDVGGACHHTTHHHTRAEETCEDDGGRVSLIG
jgi:hypothetical protein